MTSTLITLVITDAVVAILLVRSLTWQSVTLAKLTRLPVVFAILGTLSVSGTVSSLGRGWHPTVADISVLAVELVVAVTVGWAMGRLSEFRTMDGKVVSRLRPAGAAAFLAFIGLRVALTLVGGHLGVTPALMSSSVLLVIAVIRFTQSVVLREAVAAHTGGVSGVTDSELRLR